MLTYKLLTNNAVQEIELRKVQKVTQEYYILITRVYTGMHRYTYYACQSFLDKSSGEADCITSSFYKKH